jgi:hypothetical protein
VADVADAILSECDGDRMLSSELTRLVAERLAADGEIVSDAVCWNGLKLLQARNELRVHDGQGCWVKPTATSRSWERRDMAAALA